MFAACVAADKETSDAVHRTVYLSTAPLLLPPELDRGAGGGAEGGGKKMSLDVADQRTLVAWKQTTTFFTLFI